MADTLKEKPMSVADATAACEARGDFYLLNLDSDKWAGMDAEAFIRKFLTEWNGKHTTVYFKPGHKLHNTNQCHLGARRSVGDVYLVTKHYIEGITLLETRRILKLLVEKGALNSYICTTIKRRVFWVGVGLADSKATRDEFGWTYNEPTILVEAAPKEEQKVQYA